MPSSIEDVEEAHQQIPHSVWLEGPEYSARQIGVRGIAYETYLTARPTTVPPGVKALEPESDASEHSEVERSRVMRGDLASLDGVVSP